MAEVVGESACGVVPVRSCSTIKARPVVNWRRALLAPIATVTALSALAGGVVLVGPFRHHLTPPCPFHALTGLWCPFCGGARALWAAGHGDFRLMLHSNALLPVFVVAVGWGWLVWLGRATGWWSLPVPRGRAFSIAVLVALVAFTVVRNLPGLGALAPPGVA